MEATLTKVFSIVLQNEGGQDSSCLTPDLSQNTSIGQGSHRASIACFPEGPMTTSAPEASAEEAMAAASRLLTLQAQAYEVVN